MSAAWRHSMARKNKSPFGELIIRTLIESLPGSIICRFRSIEQARFFCEPVELDFELTDLLIKLRFESFFFMGVSYYDCCLSPCN